MDVSIVEKPAFAVMGIEGSGAAERGPEWIGPLWGQAFSRVHEIQHLITGGAWGAMSDAGVYLARWGVTGRYLAGWEVSADCPPVEGWTIWRIPPTTFAAIACTMATYQDALRYGNEVFLKESGYEPAGAIHEVYPPEFRNPASDTLYLYFMVKAH